MNIAVFGVIRIGLLDYSLYRLCSEIGKEFSNLCLSQQIHVT